LYVIDGIGFEVGVPARIIGYYGWVRPLSILAIFLFSTSLAAQSGGLIRRLDGPGLSAGSGGAIAQCGDLNLDGVPDMIVGGDRYITWGTATAMVYSGADGSIIWSWGGFTNAEAVANAGDVDGDMIEDLLVGSIWTNFKSGQAKVFSGATGIELYSLDGAAADDYFGNAVAGAGDVNGDGYSDFLIGAYGESAVLPFSGSVSLYSGFDGSLIRKYSGQIDHGYFGCDLANVGDTDGDGIPDHLIGEVGNDTLGSSTGAAYLYSGATGTLINQWIGVAANSRFGESLAAVGDIDLDGAGDFAISAMFEAPAGHARVYSGGTGVILHDFALFEASEVFGRSIAGGGDVNGDGVPDIVVGSDRFYLAGGYTGLSHVFSGADGRELQRFEPNSPDGRFGLAVASLGDIDLDGFSDFAVGAPAEGFAGHQSGSVYVISGKLEGVLLSVRNLRSGGLARVDLRGCTPNGLAMVGYSMAGAGPTGTVYGMVEMSVPIHTFPPIPCDADGIGFFTPQVPPSTGGLNVWCQAVDLSSGEISNPHPMRVSN